MNSLLAFQTDWRDSTSAPLSFPSPGRAVAQASDYRGNLLDGILASGGVDAAARLGAYRYQYWFRLLTLLQKDFPTLGHLMGWEAFNPVAAEFLRSHPPGRDLGRLGRDLPEWLEGRGMAARFLEAARVDLAWSEAFAAPDLPVPSASDLESIGSGRSEIVLQPSVRILRLSRDWFPLKTALERGEAADEGTPARMSGWWVVSRTGPVLRAQRIEPALCRFLTSMRKLPWTRALDLADRRDRGIERKVGDWFETGTASGWWGLRTISVH